MVKKLETLAALRYPMVRSPRPWHRLTAAITSWFRLPDQGMKNYEMLCRGTAFCVKAPNDPKLYFVTCSHIAAPWKWPKLYPLPWLQHVNERDARCVLHVTEPSSGRVLERVEMEEDVTHHLELDACVLTLKDQDRALKLFESHGMPLMPITIGKETLKQGQMVVCPGYGVSKSSKGDQEATFQSDGSSSPAVLDDDEAYRRGLIATVGPGVGLDLRTDAELRRLSVTTGAATQFHNGPSRGFVVTDGALADGVCGAPMVDLESGECVGLMEGVVPNPVPGMDPASDVHKVIAGSAAVIYGPELAGLVDEARQRFLF